ncbi:MAG: sodium/solute symporter [Candidatus Hydrogenedentes bacterium]|nr:sodium/solute symporter [Candidatus Hydrogenedentota bacterium]
MEELAPEGRLNYVVLVLYLGAMVGVGLYFARRQKNARDFFLAGNRMPWIVVAMSVFASITSAVSFMGVPGIVYRENVSILVGIAMLPVVSPLIILLFFPFYRRLNVTTSYEYVLRRFGPSARYAVSGLFVLARLGWLGTIIYAPALAFSAVTGFDMWISIIVMGALGTFYTALGGIEAVIRTDVIQFVVMVGGAIWVAVALAIEVPGGVPAILQTAADTGHLNLYEWRPSLTEMTVGAVMVSYFFNLLHDYGVDQVTVQRLLSSKDYRSMAWATVTNSLITLAVMTLLAFIGLGLFAYYTVRPEGLPEGVSDDRIFPYFMVTALPAGIASFVVSGFFAAAMSGVDSGINSVSTVLVSDFIRPSLRRPLSDKAELALARGMTLLLGVLSTGLAFFASSLGSIMRASQAFLGLFSGPVLALFLLGVLTRRGTFGGWCAGVGVAIPLVLYVQRYTAVHFIYYFPLSFLVCFGVGYLASFAGKKRAPQGLTAWDLWRESANGGDARRLE